MRMLIRLLRPLDYLRIRHAQKIWYDWTIPIVIAVAVLLVIELLPGEIQVLGEHGLVSIVTGLLQVLTGFYIASLAAVATFGKPEMDAVMDGEPPTLKTEMRGHPVKVDLSRRRFLSLMFGYLALLSLALYFLGAAGNLIAPNLQLLMGETVYDIVSIVCTAIYLFLCANLMVTTLLGLYYMADRIHWPDQKLRVKPPIGSHTDDE